MERTMSSATTYPPLDAGRLVEAFAELEQGLEGEVRCDPLHRMLYATDASLYAEAPLGVVYPRGRGDVVAIVRWAARRGVALIPRTGGTSLAGQCVGAGLVVDMSRHMTAILEVDAVGRRARVEPGVILDALNAHLAPQGLLFGPDTSTSNRCMIGGMIGNNSCGSHSILYGNTLAHTLEVEAVLSDGSVARFGPLDAAGLAAKLAEDSLEGTIHRTLHGIVSAHRDEILRRFPRPEVTRRNMGYALDYLAHTAPFDPAGPPWNLAKFLCGSEGTLALVTEATVGLVARPTRSAVVAAHFDSLDAALRATVIAVGHQPAAVELIDRRTFEATKGNLEQARNRDWIEGDPEAALIIEFYRDSAQALAEATAGIIEALRAHELGYAYPVLEPPATGRIWALRKAGLGILMGIPGDVKPVTFVEDTAVPVTELPEYIRQFSRVLARHETQCVYYAHASVGELHLRPELNLKDPVDVEKMKQIAVEVADLVRAFGGSISGEHGDGRVRSPLIRQMLGDEVYELLRQAKGAFDPAGLFNPGKIIDPAPIDEALRFPPGAPVPRLETYFAYSEDDGIVRAIERCNGAGACRKLVGSGGTMCPSYMATREEQHTTRGRANAFRMLLLGERPEDAWGSRELYDALELCISCKGCKSECPASVDMAKLKAEFLQHYQDLHGTPLRSRFFGDPVGGYKLARRFSRLSNWAVRTRLGKAALRWALGVHPARDLPTFARRTLRQRLARRQPLPGAGERGRVLLFIDLFTDYNEPHVGLAAVELLEAAGYEVITIEHPPSARTQLSKGLVREARALIERNVELLAPYAREGVAIVGIEPSAILTFVDEAPELVRPALREAAREVAARVMLVEGFVAAEAKAGRLHLRFKEAPARVLLHGHCHQKALVGDAPVLDALRLVPGWQVEAMPTGCCGMAGSFGYEAEHHALSMQIGELVLFPTVRGADAATLIAAPGTSCRHQIADGTGRRARHPIALLRDALDPSHFQPPG